MLWESHDRKNPQPATPKIYIATPSIYNFIVAGSIDPEVLWEGNCAI